MSPSSDTSNSSGGVTISGTVGSVSGDIVGGDKIIHGPSAEELVVALGKMGVLQNAEAAGLQRRTIIMLAQRLKPDERLSFDQAIKELERAVEVAFDVIARGERGTCR